MTHIDFTGKTALIIGGSSGIGNGIAQAFVKAGARVHVWGTRANKEAYKDEPGSDLTGLTYASVNVSDPEAIELHKPRFETLDVLVLCQGAVRYGRAEFEPEGWHEVMDVNLHSLMDCCRKFHSDLKATNGSIIIVSSTSAFHATVGNPAYAASKAGAVSLCRTLGKAWIRDGIRVNGIAPGFVATKMTKVTMDNEERHQAALKRIPMGRTGTPSEMAGAALFLASDLSSYMIGQTLTVDGGLML